MPLLVCPNDSASMQTVQRNGICAEVVAPADRPAFDYAAYTLDYMDRFARAHAAFQR